MKVQIFKDDDENYLKNKINRFIENKNIIDIKFHVNNNIHSGYNSSFSSGEYYYTLIMYDE